MQQDTVQDLQDPLLQEAPRPLEGASGGRGLCLLGQLAFFPDFTVPRMELGLLIPRKSRPWALCFAYSSPTKARALHVQACATVK